MGNSMTKTRARYQSYLLRLWQDDDEEQSAWRASLIIGAAR